MKKIYILFALLWFGSAVNAQLFRASIKLDIKPANDTYGDGCDNKIQIYLRFSDGSETAIMPYIDLNSIPENPYTRYEASITFPANKVPVSLRTNTSREWKRLVGGCGGNGSFNNSSRVFGVNYCYNYFDEDATPGSDNYARWWNTKITLDINPLVSIISPSTGTMLPSKDKFTLKATAGFQPFVYTWQYRVGTTGNWQDMPAALNTQGRDSISFSGEELLGVAGFANIMGNSNVFFRLKYCNNLFTPILTAIPTLSSPRITSVTTIPNTCFGEENGSFVLKFDRALLANELLNVVVSDAASGEVISNITNISTLEPSNQITSPSTLAPGSYKIELLGKYNGNATYTESAEHVGLSSFTGPAAVDFNTSKRDIYCHNGKDGTITINANGGNGGFRAFYKKQAAATYTEIAFASAGQHTINNLDTGTYQIRVLDQKGCFKKDAAGNEVIATVTITQPAEPLRIDYNQVINPTAFGYANGSIQAIVVGGTANAGNYIVQWTDINGTVLSNFTNTNSPFKTVLNNVADGKYILKVTDNNYALAQAANATGCAVIDTFTVTQPQPLEVAIEQYRYISCKGDADGQLYARAKGGIIIPGQKYVYEWFKSNNGTFTPVNQIDSIITNLSIGTYKVKITDQNNISKESEPFTLIEPEVLAISLSATPVNCNGNNNGTASAAITGGTLPYTIEWSNGATTTTISQLTEGNYLAFVTDARGCQVQAQIQVSAPNPVLVTGAVVKQPTCFGSNDGEISHNIGGGTAPYQYLWNNGATTASISNLTAGSYSLVITDGKGCTKTVSYTLDNPPAAAITLGPDITICTDQVHEANATIANGVTYKWTSTNGFTANTARVSLSIAGIYYVEAVTDKGCIARDTIEIKKSNAVIASEFVVTTQTFKGETIELVNISNPAPQNVEWLIPNNPNLTVINKTNDNLQLRFTANGNYSIGLKAVVGDCFKVFTKNITVIEGTSFNAPGNVKDPFIKSFIIAPNPNSGTFTAKIELQENAPIKLRLLNTISGQLMHTREERGNSSYTLTYNLTLAAGVYAMVLETPKGNMVFKVLVL